MGQPEIQQKFDSVSVEGFDQIYQPDPTQAQSTPELTQADPMLMVQAAPDQNVQPDPSQGIALEEAAKTLGLHIDTVRKRLQKGKLQGFKIADKFGDKWFVHKEGLERTRPIQASPIVRAQAAPDLAQDDPVLEIDIGPELAQASPDQIIQSNPSLITDRDQEYERLMTIIEQQAYQLKAAGDVIVYLRSEVDDAKTQVKLLTDSQHKRSSWSRFWSWFLGR
jgi:hypothetical protein